MMLSATTELQKWSNRLTFSDPPYFIVIINSHIVIEWLGKKDAVKNVV